MNLIGEVLGKEVVIMDDIIDTGGTLSEAARSFCSTAPSTSTPAAPTRALRAGGPGGSWSSPEPPGGHRHHPLERIGQQCPKIVPRPVAPLFAQAILRIHQEDSISSLFEIQF